MYNFSCFRWEYQTAEELNGKGLWGQMASYGGGGYTQLLGKTKADSKLIIEDLKVSGDLRFLLNQTCLLISTPRYFT